MKKTVLIVIGLLIVVAPAQAGDLKFENTSEGMVKQLAAPADSGEEVVMQSGESMSFHTNTIKVVEEKDYAKMANEYTDKQDKRHVNLKVEFDSGSYAIRDDSGGVLSELVEAMKSPELQGKSFAIGGHTDSMGNEDFNKSLSLSRAASVKEFLVSKGIPADRLKTVGYGEGKPIMDNDTPENRQINRRVEIAVE